MSIRTPDEVRAEFQRKGISISQWAAANGFAVNMVFEVLAGRKKGVRGQAHRIAVKLGLKEGEVVDAANIADAYNAYGFPINAPVIGAHVPDQAALQAPSASPEHRARKRHRAIVAGAARCSVHLGFSRRQFRTLPQGEARPEPGPVPGPQVSASALRVS